MNQINMLPNPYASLPHSLQYVEYTPLRGEEIVTFQTYVGSLVTPHESKSLRSFKLRTQVLKERKKKKKFTKRSYKMYKLLKQRKKKKAVSFSLSSALSGFKNRPVFSVAIRLTQNNVFCTLKNLVTKKTLQNSSSGTQGVHTSKKSLRYSCRQLVPAFLKRIPAAEPQSVFIANITVPKRLRKFVALKLANRFKGSRFFLFLNGKKCFNGCRPSKQRRKKHQKYRVFK